MVQDDKKKQNMTIYEIDNKKYTVITECIENGQSIDKLYEIICKYASSQISSKLHI